VILSKNRVLTNSHILEPESEYRVDGKDARLIGRSKVWNLALLAVETDELPTVQLADFDEAGAEIFCVGNPGPRRNVVAAGSIIESDAEFVYADIFDDIKEAMGASGSGVYSPQGFLVGLKKGMLRDPSGNAPLSACIPGSRIKQFLMDMGQGKLVRAEF